MDKVTVGETAVVNSYEQDDERQNFPEGKVLVD